MDSIERSNSGGGIIETLNQRAQEISSAIGALTMARENAVTYLETLGVPDDLLAVAAVIDLVKVKNNQGKPETTQRIVRNMITCLVPGEPYCIVAVDELPKFIKGAVLDDVFLRPYMSRGLQGGIKSARISYHEKPKRDRGDSVGVFSALVDTDDQTFNCNGTDKLRSFFGDPSFEIADPVERVVATSRNGSEVLVADPAHMLELFTKGIKIVADIKPTTSRLDLIDLELIEANLGIMNEMRINPSTLKRAVAQLDRHSRKQLLENIVSFLAEKEQAFRGGGGSCRVDHAYLYDQVPTLKDYPNLTNLFGKDIKQLVYERVGRFQSPRTRASSLRRRPVRYK